MNSWSQCANDFEEGALTPHARLTNRLQGKLPKVYEVRIAMSPKGISSSFTSQGNSRRSPRTKAGTLRSTARANSVRHLLSTAIHQPPRRQREPSREVRETASRSRSGFLRPTVTIRRRSAISCQRVCDFVLAPTSMEHGRDCLSWQPINAECLSQVDRRSHEHNHRSRTKGNGLYKRVSAACRNQRWSR